MKLGKVFGKVAARSGLSLLCLLPASCYVMWPSSGGGQTRFEGPRRINPADVALPPGYKIEAVATGLTFPTGVTFDPSGVAYVTESGYSYGEVWTYPRLLRITAGGRASVVATGDSNGPWNGVTYHKGHFYVAEGGEVEGGRILRISRSGAVKTLISGLPSMGDHHTNGPVIGPDGWIYFGQGTATNSAVVGNDNFQFGWLKRCIGFHDIPAHDIVLTGRNFTTRDVFRPGLATTGAYVPFGTPTFPGQVIHGSLPCTGAILKIPPTGGRPALVAWGLRNPFGLAFDHNGQLFVTENSYDDRGSRPVWGSGDPLWRIRAGTWYGWPDFAGGLPLDQKKPPGKARPQPLLATLPNPPPQPAATFGVHASADGLDFSRSAAFGHQGQAFVALFGDQAPTVGKVLAPVGFKVVRVDVDTGVIEDFAVNKGHKNAPASAQRHGGLERPLAARFSPDGRSLYVVDFGVLRMDSKGSHPRKNTGVLWRISRD